MADIKDYLEEREKRDRKRKNYQQTDIVERIKTVFRFGLVILVVVAVIALIFFQYKKHIYTGYDIVSTIPREKAAEAVDVSLQNSILTYSKDGVHCTDIKGDVKWNQTYQIQDIKLATCQNVAALGNYNGREIYVQNTEKQLGTVNTAMPIRSLAVSATGHVAAILADTNVTWINIYSPDGEMEYNGQTSMNNSGYPVTLSLSPNGELLAVSYLYIDAGVLKTDIAFYNLGAVGDNYSDHVVAGYTCQDTLIPELQFMSNSAAFALGDNCLRLYQGDQIPVEMGVHFFQEEAQSVFYNDERVGVVFYSDKAEAKYRLDVFNTKAEIMDSYYFDMDYTEIIFEEDNFIVYNETECLIKTYDDVEKYHGNFTKTVNLVLPTEKAYKYVLVTNNSIDTIQLK